MKEKELINKIKADNEIWMKNQRKNLEKEYATKVDEMKSQLKHSSEEQIEIKVKEEVIRREKDIRQNI